MITQPKKVEYTVKEMGCKILRFEVLRYSSEIGNLKSLKKTMNGMQIVLYPGKGITLGGRKIVLRQNISDPERNVCELGFTTPEKLKLYKDKLVKTLELFNES